ncbi:cytochrome C [Vreelandella sulfidaeris]|uniref:Cytochrome C n=1 Tax=Vreelandella sulfidaeris TaxID=115553 RepID=A0A365TSN1_9GAMM|nr:c-type cytochrome [Halomonas sulfidaeris]RBI67986.1 cytochrome C [Halomonas sulfidaeris]
MTIRTRQRLIERIRKRVLIRLALGLVGVVIAMAVGAVMFIFWGVYNVSALQQHTEPVYTVLTTALDRSISQRAEEIDVPSLDDPAMAQQGLIYYRDKCVQCHGAPGVARQDVGKGMTPVPPNLAHTASNRTPAEIFWAIKHGIKMTGMPSWQFIFTDEEIWEIVAFMRQMSKLSPVEYQAIAARVDSKETAQTEEAEASSARSGTAPEVLPNADRGRLAMYGYACIACHRIPGLVGPQADVGPPLAGIGARRYIAGVLTNNEDNMVRWLRHPTQVDPLTAMPDLEVTERDARDMAAYLETLK